MKYQLVILLIISISMGACVSTKKYQELEANKEKLAYKLTKTMSSLDSTQQAYDKLADKNKLTTKDLNKLKTQFAELSANYDDVSKRYKDLMVQNEEQILSASNDNQRLNDALARKQQELEAEAKKLKALETSLNSSKADLNAAQAELEKATKVLADREKRLVELETVIKQQEASTNALRETINRALLGFNASDLTVEQKNGKVYVSLSQNLLFASGSTNIDNKGLDAIRKLAKVLNENTDIDITVEGHTDNVPFNGRSGMKDNWDLSVMRSTSLVRELVKNGVAPQRITASGRGEYYPIADNDTREGKAKNRRSEIILSPKLDALFSLINN